MQFRVDLSDQTAVVVCGCRQRFLGVSRKAVLERLAEHERTWHPADRNARDALDQITARRRRASKAKPATVS